MIVPFTFQYDLLFIDGLLRQSGCSVPIKFIIDTGAAGSAVDVNLVRPDFSKHSRFAEISGVGGSESVLIQKVDHLQLGEFQISGVEFQFGDLDNKFGVQGIIGNNLLKGLGSVIDFSKCLLLIE